MLDITVIDQTLTLAARIRENYRNATAHRDKMLTHYLAMSEAYDQFSAIEGWRQFGYSSATEFIEGHLGVAWGTFYRFRRTAETLAVIEAVSSNDCPIGQYRESHVRELAPLRDDPPALEAAIQKAQSLAAAEAPAGQPVQPVARHYAAATKHVQQERDVKADLLPVVAERLESGALTLAQARDINKAITALFPAHQALLVQLTHTFGLTCAELVAKIGNLFAERDKARAMGAVFEGVDALLLADVIEGYIGGTPLATATLTDWRDAKTEARRAWDAERFRREQEEAARLGKKAQWDVEVTLRVGDPAQLWKVLKRELYYSDLIALQNFISQI
jgi:hypothetical protein